MNVRQLSKEIEQYVINIRRDLHAHPEISMEEERTIRVVTNELQTMDIPYEIVPYGGIIGKIHGKGLGKKVILRADLDALPMKESPQNLTRKKVVVSKTEKAAHLCGHDAHTAMLLGSAKILQKYRHLFSGTVLLAFEQGEENGQGIYCLLKRLVDIGADGVWGIHLKNDLPTGRLSVNEGPRMAGAMPFHVEISGQSGHGSRPDLAHSPLDSFVDFYVALEQSKIRNLNPFEPITYSIGTIKAGEAPNVIPSRLEFSGTARFLHSNQGKRMKKEFVRLLEIACTKNNCSYKFVEEPIVMDLLVQNERTCSEIATEAVIKVLGKDILIDYPAWMASEPFGLYQKYFPGVFAFLGIENKEKGTGAEHHNEHFDVDEAALKNGVAATVQYALDFLGNTKEITYERETCSVDELFKRLNFPIYNPDER